MSKLKVTVGVDFLNEAFNAAAEMYPHAVDCIAFLHGVLSPAAELTDEDRAWAENLLKSRNKGVN